MFEIFVTPPELDAPFAQRALIASGLFVFNPLLLSSSEMLGVAIRKQCYGWLVAAVLTLLIPLAMLGSTLVTSRNKPLNAS